MDLQTEIFNLTEHKLKSPNVVVTCKTNSLGRGVDEKVKIIDDKITFTFNTCDFGKTINSLQISMNNGQVKHDFGNKEFAGKASKYSNCSSKYSLKFSNASGMSIINFVGYLVEVL